MKKLFPNLLDVELPLTGQYLIDKSCFDIERLSDDFSLEVNLLLFSKTQGLKLRNVQIGVLEHAERPLERDGELSYQILSFLIDASRLRLNERILVVMAHSDDPVIWSGGLLTKYLSAGAYVDIIVFCSNHERERELRTIEQYFPYVNIDTWNLFEFDNWPNRELCIRLSQYLLGSDTSLVITHHINDPHNDHMEVAKLVRSAILQAGSINSPRKVLMCPPYFNQISHSHCFDPDIFLNITEEADVKEFLIGKHSSQNPDYWIEMVGLMDRLIGLKSGVHRAEAYEIMRFYRTPLADEFI